MTATQLPTANDPPVTVDGSSLYDVTWMRYVEDRFVKVGGELVEQRNRTFDCSYPRLDPAAPGPIPNGYAVALRASVGANLEPLIVLATAANLAAGGILMGVTTETVPLGARGRVATEGILPASITGLPATGGKYVRANSTTGLLERVTSLSATDVFVGFAQPDGAMVVGIGTVAGTTMLRYGALTYPGPVNVASMGPGPGDHWLLTLNDTNAFTVNAPTGYAVGQTLEIRFRNSSGGVMGTPTLTGFTLAGGTFTKPANGKSRIYSFFYDGTTFYDRSAGDL